MNGDRRLGCRGMPIPASNSDQAVERLNALLETTTRYLGRDDLRIRVVERLGTDLLRSNAVNGYIVLSAIAALRVTRRLQEATPTRP